MVFEYTKNEQGEYICPHCNYTAKHQSTMHYHLKKHEGALPHACSHCKMRFVQKSLLDLHIKARHPQATEKKEYVECPVPNCGYKDIRKANCVIHFARIHLREIVDKLKGKPSNKEEKAVCVCTKCDKSFKSATHYYYHAATCISLAPVHPMADMWQQVKA